MVRLGDVCDDKIQRIKSISEQRIAYIDIASIDNVQKRVIGVKEHDVYDAPGRAQQVVIPGDVLVSNVRPNLNAVAIVDVASAIPLIASTGFCVLRVKDMVLPEYVYYYAQTSNFIDPLVAVSEKASYPSVTDTIVKDSLMPLPPLSVQREIVARLERELVAVEKIKKDFEALAETAKAEFKAELKEVFEEISRRGAEMRRLGEVCELCLGKMLDKAKNKGSYKPYLRNVNVRWDGFSLDDLYEMRFEDDETERYSLRKGDIVMCEGGEPGRCAVWKGEENSMMIQKALHRIRPNRATDSRYLLFAFMNLSQSGYFAERFTGTTIKHLTGQVLREVLIPLPPLPAQREVVARLEGAKAKTEKIEAKAREGVAICETMRKAILKEAFDLGRKG